MNVIRTDDHITGRIIIQASDNLLMRHPQIALLIATLPRIETLFLIQLAQLGAPFTQIILDPTQNTTFGLIQRRFNLFATLVRSDQFNYHTTVICTLLE